MKKLHVLVMAFCMVVVDAAEMRAADLSVDSEAELKAVSAFVWRGRTINDEPCFQPSITAKTGNFTASLWASWNLTTLSNAWQNGRLDATFYYDYSYKHNILRPGFAAYIYHDDPAGKAKDTYEWFLGYTYDTLLLPTLIVYYDFSKMDGIFASAAVSHSFTVIPDKMAVDLKLQLDCADRYYNNSLFSYPAADGTADIVPDKGSFVDLSAKVSVPIKVGKNCTLTPEIRFVTLVDQTIRDIVDQAGEDVDILVYGLAFSATF